MLKNISESFEEENIKNNKRHKDILFIQSYFLSSKIHLEGQCTCLITRVSTVNRGN